MRFKDIKNPFFSSKWLALLLIPLFFVTTSTSLADNTNTATPQQVTITSSDDFFDESLNDLEEERDIAKEENKKGILLMFEMDECPFCKRMKKTVLNRKEVQDFFRKNFRILSIDVEGDLELTDFQGKETTQKEFSLKEFRVRATPVFQFVGLDGKPLKNGRLTGATKDVKEFMLLGKFIVDGENNKQSFSRYKRKLKKASNE